MKKLGLLVLSFGLLFSLSGFAADNFKIGVVDFQTILKSAPQVAQARTKLRNQFQSEQKKIQKKQESLKALMDKYKRNSTIMRDEDKKSMQNEMSKKQNELLRLSQEYQQKAMQAQQEAMLKIMNHINEVVGKIAEKQDLDMVIPRNLLSYAKSKYDITAQVQKALR